MTDRAVENTAMISRPTLLQRLWRRLGFGKPWDETLFEWRSADPTPSDWFVPGVFTTYTTIHVDWRDRLRLLISGRCAVDVYSRTDVIIRRDETRSEFYVLPPGRGR